MQQSLNCILGYEDADSIVDSQNRNIWNDHWYSGDGYGHRDGDGYGSGYADGSDTGIARSGEGWGHGDGYADGEGLSNLDTGTDGDGGCEL